MVSIEKINDGCDIKAEIIAADLMERGVDSTRVGILPIGSFSRKYRKDVVEIQNAESEDPDRSYLLNVSRDGLFEHLPQALFLLTERSELGKMKSFEDKLDEIRRQRAEAAEAKKFFSILEREINHSRVMVEVQERKSIFGIADESYSDLFTEIWPELNAISEKYRGFLFQILPLAHRCRTDLRLSEALLGYVLNLPVQLAASYEPHLVAADEGVDALYGSHLGIDMILGRTNPVYEQLFDVKVYDVPRTEIESFLEGGAAHNVLLFLLEYFLPFDADVSTWITVREDENSLLLGKEKDFSYLNYNSVIKP